VGTEDMLVRMIRLGKLNLVCSIALLAPGIFFIAIGLLHYHWTVSYIADGWGYHGPIPGMLAVPGTIMTVPGLMLFCVSINIAPKRIERILNLRWR